MSALSAARGVRPLVVAGLCLLPACGRREAPSPSPQEEPWLRPVLEELAAAHGRRGLPELPPAEIREYREVLEAWRLARGRLRGPLQRDLESRPADRLSAALLAALEDLRAPVEERRAAYAWLEARGVPAILPRLVLRLKYETDWAANLPLVRTLLRLGNGAGLAALETILRDEDPAREALRAEAAAALLLLPPGDGWKPEPDRPLAERFAGDFARLLAVRATWDRERRLVPRSATGKAAVSPDPLDRPEVRAEVVGMLHRLAEQNLRPVDDARFVLARLQVGVVPFLCACARDRRLHVREACLQVLSWIGPAAGRAVLAGEASCLQTLTRGLDRDPLARPRLLEALGALGLPASLPAIRTWLSADRPEVVAAAADALLRCAPEDPALLPEVRGLLARDWLPPEARWSLELLAGVLDPSRPPPEAPPDLPAGEVERRRRWLQERALRPVPPPASAAGPPSPSR